ncbi:MAG TPA: MBOAT family O-acyltransferase [Oligoflexus sp.]|uniref:MBOAT family O-acyltransferase n=1 Tax=Oligoflexus sp. TaxID=1971216 RepID=UPI002D7E5C40|nr:MBOAT family O-acyltransferase [Oligoflexus sp.]HET9238038.1 MBOAT family O-acyltransferase [Oligoflexus sp.]
MKAKFHSRPFPWNRAARDLFIHPGILLLNVISFLTIALFSGTILTSAFLFVHIAVNFAATTGLERITDAHARRFFYWLCVALNAGSFLILQHLGLIGILDSNNVSTPSTLPFLMGYAFYTLQALAIQGAVYRGLITGLNFQRYVLAVSFCGAFLAGPIFNQAQLKAFEDIEVSFPTPARIYQHLHFLIGALVFKYVFANWLSQWVNTQDVSSPLLIARTVLCFELQVYFDFAGYSLLSFFLCRIFCIPMYHNFQHPFAARNIPEFWRRWHVGLGTFFKENVFTPLKGIYPNQTATRMALPITVFMLSALWHGPTRNFVLWGLLHGLAFVSSVAVLKAFRPGFLLRLGTRLSVFVVLFYGRLLFMESDFGRLMHKFRELGRFLHMGRELSLIFANRESLTGLLLKNWDGCVVGLAIAGIIGYEVWGISADDRRCYRYLKPGLWALMLLLLMLLFFQPADHAGFVYGR